MDSLLSLGNAQSTGLNKLAKCDATKTAKPRTCPAGSSGSVSSFAICCRAMVWFRHLGLNANYVFNKDIKHDLIQKITCCEWSE